MTDAMLATAAGAPADHGARPTPRLRRDALRTLVVVAVFAAGMGLFLSRSDTVGVRAAAGGLSPTVFGACLALALLNYALRGARWLLLARTLGVAVPAWRQAIYYVAGFALAITPGKAGETVRLWLLHRGEGVPYPTGVTLLVGDRIFDMAAIAILAVIGAAATERHAAVTGVAALFVLAVCLVLLRPALLLAVLGRLQRHSGGGRWLPRVQAALGAQARLARPGVLAAALALSVAGWFAECMVLMLVLRDLGIEAGVFVSVQAFALSTAAGAASLLPGGLGAADFSLLGLLRLDMVPAAEATVATLAVRLATLWFAVALGLLALAPAVLMARRR
jgi:glycosyltransferase 2 family protein